VVEEFVEFWEH